MDDENGKDGVKQIPDEKTEIPKTKTPKEAYFEQLEIWVKQANISYNAMACFPYYLMANYPHLVNGPGQQHPMFNSQQPLLFTPTAGIDPNAPQPQPNIALQRLAMNIFNRNRVRQDNMFDNNQRNEDIINQNGGYEYIIAPLWKRFVAETIDVCILFVIKLVIAFMIIDIFEIDFGFNFEAIRNSLEDDYTEFITFSSEMIYIEIVTKIFVCIYEALWTRQGHGQIGGATPGKIFMGIRIIHVEAVVMLDQPPPPNVNNITQPPMRALVYPAQNPGFQLAFGRALSKNLLLAFLFPFCFVMLFFRNNRTSYDMLTKTMVVEENLAPILRRR